MKTIQKDPSNIGGIAKVWAIPSSLTEIPKQPATPNTFLLPAGFQENTWELRPIYQSIKFTESCKQTTAGLMHESLISFNIAKNTPDRILAMNYISGRTWAILFQDQNGLYKLVGSNLYPMRLSTTGSIGAEISDLNSIHLEFSGSSQYPSIFIDNPF